MKLESLTKENFWNELYEKYPGDNARQDHQNGKYLND